MGIAHLFRSVFLLGFFPVPPVLIAMCGLPFSGKSTLAKSLGGELGIRMLSYDFEIWVPHHHLVPPGFSVSDEYDFVQDIARREIRAILSSGQSLIYDDLLLDRDDRQKLTAAISGTEADLLFLFLDTPMAVIDQRRAANSRLKARTSIPDEKMALDASHLELPGGDEPVIYIRPDDVLPDIVSRIGNRLPAIGQ
jgi:predicted kinase